MNEIQNLQPQCIWKNFYALTQVPRPSGHLEKIQQFLLDFGKQAGVYAVKDPRRVCLVPTNCLRASCRVTS